MRVGIRLKDVERKGAWNGFFIGLLVGGRTPLHLQGGNNGKENGGVKSPESNQKINIFSVGSCFCARRLSKIRNKSDHTARTGECVFVRMPEKHSL